MKEAIYLEDTNKITQDNILVKKRNNNNKEKVNMTKKSKISLTKLMKEWKEIPDKETLPTISSALNLNQKVIK